GLSAVLAVLLVVMVAVPLIAQSDLRAEAAPLQPRPDLISLASPTPGMTDEARRDLALPVGDSVQPPATLAAVMFEAGASPVPVPSSAVSPVARVGWR
ncbi:MAG: hypothetical protein JW910_14995, partial [Anaerolineae bacterium]|nr:hypothetical protein [Anaerolineae bacterium]